MSRLSRGSSISCRLLIVPLMVGVSLWIRPASVVTVTTALASPTSSLASARTSSLPLNTALMAVVLNPGAVTVTR